MDAATLGKAIGLKKSGRIWTGACPCCNYKSGFEVEDKERTTLFKCHAGGCTQSDVIETLRHQGLWSGEKDRDWTPPARHAPTDNGADRAAVMGQAARDLWKKAAPAAGTLVETYLRSRGITLPVPQTLRHLSGCKHAATGLFLPAMISAVAVVPGREVVAIHRTFLASDGRRKAQVSPDKMTLGPVAGGAVRLGPASPIMLVSEGIETCLSSMQASGLPGWAALSAGNMRAMIMPALPMAAEIIICADHDENNVGQSAAAAAATRWHHEGRKVRIALPPIPGTDFNDMIQGDPQ